MSTSVFQCSMMMALLVLVAMGCTDHEAERERAADAAFDRAYDYCIYTLKKNEGECEVYMEQHWQSFYVEPDD
jgi:hypothetical protein